MERAQRRFTRMFSHLRHLDYSTRLDILGWSLEERVRNRADLIEVFTSPLAELIGNPSIRAPELRHLGPKNFRRPDWHPGHPSRQISR